MTTPDTPAAACTLLRQLAGWSTEVRHSTGPCEFGGLSETTDGDGRRRRITVIETVNSVLVRARHVDGRALVALWIRRPAGRRAGWTLDMAWRGRHPGDLAPQRITARQLTAYASAPDPRTALRAVAALAPRAEQLKEAG